MSNHIVKASAGRGKHRVNGISITTSKGLIVAILGGEIPHVGATSIAIPRPSLKTPSKLSATSSIITLVGHKDDEIAKPISERFAKELNQVTVVIAGAHINNASKTDIETLVKNSMKAADKLIIKLKSRRAINI